MSDIHSDTTIHTGNNIITDISIVCMFFAISLFPVITHAGFIKNAFAQGGLTSSDSIPTLKNPTVLALLSGDSLNTIKIDENAMYADNTYTLVSDDEIIPETSEISTYTVQPGDSLSAIADRFKISTNTIRWANGLGSKGTIRVGQELVILPVTGVRHRVVKGDTIVGLAKKYDSDASDIADYNGMEISDRLTVGDNLIIPDGDGTIFEEKKVAKKKVVRTDKIITDDSTAPRGYFIRPVRGIKTQGFHGPYQAVDVYAPEGTPIVAAADGVVIVAKGSGYNGGYGGLTIIKHPNGSQSLYAHQSRVIVTAGQTVRQGEKIGEVGHTGRVIGRTGNHLHLEFRGIKTPILY